MASTCFRDPHALFHRAQARITGLFVAGSRLFLGQQSVHALFDYPLTLFFFTRIAVADPSHASCLLGALWRLTVERAMPVPTTR
jgi:hypothetical protein